MDYDDFDEPVKMAHGRYNNGTIEVTGICTDEESGGCFTRLIKGMRACWSTKQTEDIGDDRELLIKTTLRELIIYMIFLVVLMIISMGMVNSLSFYFTTVLNGLFLNTAFNGSSVNYGTATCIADYWNFLSGPLLGGLYWNQWYNTMPVSDSDINYIHFENKLIGVPRLRQIRIQNNTCIIASEFKNTINSCFDSYSRNIESTDSFGPANSSAWNYISEKDLGSRPSLGSLTTYGGGGFYVDLNQTQSDSLKTINFLFNNLWIDMATRAVIVDFTVYNPNLNLFCVIKLVAEFPSTGGMIPNSEFRTVKLIRYVTPLDYLVMACELIFLVFILYYIIEELIEIQKHRMAYFSSFWNCLDVAVIVLSVLTMSLNINRTISVQNLLTNLLIDKSAYSNFDLISSYQLQFNYSLAMTLFLAWVKVFKYISFNKTMTQLSETLGRCAKDLLGFSVMFFLVFVGFAQLGYLLFGSQLADFQSLSTSIYTLFRVILGDFDFSQFQKFDRVIGPIYFLLYVFFVFFILFNMFLAIIFDTYSEVKEDLAKQANEFEMADYLKQRANFMLSKLNIKKAKIIDIQKAINMADANNDNIIDFDEWKSELKLRGFGDEEIEAVFAKYDTNCDRTLDLLERQKMQDELEYQKKDLSSEIKKGEMDCTMNICAMPAVSVEDYSALANRVNRMDNTIELLFNKIDTVSKNIDNMEHSQSNKRETMVLILETLRSNDNLSDEDKNRKIVDLATEEISKMNKEAMMSTTSKSKHKSEKDFHGKY